MASRVTSFEATLPTGSFVPSSLHRIQPRAPNSTSNAAGALSYQPMCVAACTQGTVLPVPRSGLHPPLRRGSPPKQAPQPKPRRSLM